MSNIKQYDHILMIGPSGCGKSTFIPKMSPEYLIVDVDNRIGEQKFDGTAHVINVGTNALEIVRSMDNLLPKLIGKVGTVCFDSGTGIMDSIQARGRLQEIEARKSGSKFNMNDVHREKADTMRVLITASQRWACNTAWIFHIDQSGMSGQTKERITLSPMEIDRLKKVLNVILVFVKDKKQNMRGVRIEWTRFNMNIDDVSPANGHIIWDVDGYWKGVPQKVHDFIRSYKGTEGYKGIAYSPKWLIEYMAKNGKEYTEKAALDKLGLPEWPVWWDRNSWAEIVEKLK